VPGAGVSLTPGRSAALLLGSLLFTGTAFAQCNPPPTCSASTIVSYPGCCTATACSLGTIVLSGRACDLDFRGRNVVLNGTLVVGSNTVSIEAGSFHILGLVDASATPPNSGGIVTITTTGASAAAFSVGGSSTSGINLQGSVGGALTVHADGPVAIMSGKIDASAADSAPDGSGGSIELDSSAGDLVIATSVLANGGGSGFGGAITVRLAGGLTVTDTGRLRALGGLGGGGTIDVIAGGAVTIGGQALVQADAAGGSAGNGGSIEMTGASITVNGLVEATGGSDATGDAGGDGGSITLEATEGALTLSGGAQGLSVDGASGGGNGEICLTTDSLASGDVTIAAPVSAQGRGGPSAQPAGGGEVDVSSARGVAVTQSISVAGTGGGTGVVDLGAQRDVVVNTGIFGDDPAGGGALTIGAGHDAMLSDVGRGNTVRMGATAGETHAFPSGPGGEIAISAGNDVQILGFVLEVGGVGTGVGGDIALDAGHDLHVDRQSLLNADSSSGSGVPAGRITLTAGSPDRSGSLLIEGDLTANGHTTSPPTSPGSILLTGCQVVIATTGLVDSTGDPGSVNQVSARTSTRHCRNDPTKSCTSTAACGGSGCDAAIAVLGKLKASSNIAIYPKTCSGGTNAGRPCATDADCPSATCGSPPTVAGGTVVPGFTSMTKLPCECGDAVVDAARGETCDPPGSLAGAAGNVCRSDCTVCGDGVVQPGERCDDGNGVDNDACPNDCGVTTPPPPPDCLMPCPTCGDGTRTFPEQCDPPGCANDCDIHCRTFAPAFCLDANPCTFDDCDDQYGCLNTPRPDGSACSDQSVCTTGDTCEAALCVGTGTLDCDDADVCTDDTCDPASGCLHTPVVCADDGNACNGAETCTDPIGCHHGALVSCPSGTVCRPSDGACVSKPCSGPADCDDGNGCTADTCVSGRCNSSPDPAATCSDGNPCNGAETCQGGICTPGVPPSCDDANACTRDGCDPTTGCVHEAIVGCTPCQVDTDCNDPCAQCVDGRCSNILGCCSRDAECDDGEPCTTDTCLNGAGAATGTCSHEGLPDGSAPGCTSPCASCVAGACRSTECPDPNPDDCEVPTCDPAGGGCVTEHAAGCCLASDAECDDGDACTLDTCDATVRRCVHALRKPDCVTCWTDIDCDVDGACGGVACGGDGTCMAIAAPNCDDRRPSFSGTCRLDAALRPYCEYRCLTDQACDDGNACNGTERCSAGSCVPGTPLACDDADACTDDGCDPALGCVNAPKTGYASVRCRLDTMEAALAAAGAGEVASSVRTKLGNMIRRARAKLAVAERTGSGKRAFKSLNAARRQVKAIGKAVNAALRKKKMAPRLAQILAELASRGGDAVDSLKAGTAP